MRSLWSEQNKRLTWRQIWTCLAEAQHAAGLVSSAELEDIRANSSKVDIEKSLEYEKKSMHDLVAELQTFSDQCRLGGRKLHLGATSMDIEDNADALRIKASLGILIRSINELLRLFAEKIESWADVPIIAYTHLQPAEPTTMGYRLAQYASDLLEDAKQLKVLLSSVKGKGIKGAVGTSSSYEELLKNVSADSGKQLNGPHRSVFNAQDLETYVMKSLGIQAFSITTQTYPRKQDYRVLSQVSSIACTLYKFAFDLRILQMPQIGELSEPIGIDQISSSTMPFKKNPIHSETINSLARLIAALPRIAWDNASHSLLERTLDDGANRRELLPVAFLALDEIIRRAINIVSGLQINLNRVKENFYKYSVFAGTERLIMALISHGADRQEVFTIIRRHSTKAWTEIETGNPNPLEIFLTSDAKIRQFLTKEEILFFLDPVEYLGNTKSKCKELVTEIRTFISLPD